MISALSDASAPSVGKTTGSTVASGAFPSLKFDNKLARSLPLDAAGSTGVREVSNAIFSRCVPTRVDRPRLVAASPAALALLEADERFDLDNEDALAAHLSGNEVISGSFPLAHCYAGYQVSSVHSFHIVHDIACLMREWCV